MAIAVSLAVACVTSLSQGQRSPAPAQPGASPTPPVRVPLALTGATVIDVTTGKLIPDQTILVGGNRLRSVGATRAVQIPRGTTVVDARGKYVIPGLWDMHVHVWGYPNVFYPLLIANGITGVREMSTPYFDSLLTWRREIRAGTRVGPRIVGTAGFLTSREISDQFSTVYKGLTVGASTPEEARRAVDSLKALGVDFIKVRDGMSRDVYFAAIAEARRIRIPFVGHTPVGVMADEAADSGQRTVEHIHDSSFDVCAGEPDPAGAAAPATASPAFNAAACRAFVTRFTRNEAWVVPTLSILYRMFSRAPERLRYWPDSVAAKSQHSWGPMGTPEFFAPRQHTVGTLWQMGVPLLAGTDATEELPEGAPGFALHDELALMVQGGVTPLGVLQAATINPAKYLRATDSLGTVAPGKIADLVILDANPLADITNTTKIRGVVADGRYFDRAALDRALAWVEQGAKPKPKERSARTRHDGFGGTRTQTGG